MATALVPGPRKTAAVLVGNIPYDATEDDVRAHLNQGGKVESFRMVFDEETMQPKGYGFCDFADPETAAAAIKVLGDGEFHGRLLRLRLADSFGGMPGKGVSKGGEPGKKSTVFVGNIPYDATEDDVRGHLSQGGKVESFRMVFDKETMKPKGYGFCDFADPETAAAAIKVLGDGEFHGRLLRLRLADSFGGMPGKGVSKGGEPGKKSTVFVGNIPYDATEDDVRGHLSQGGKVESFRMVFDKETMKPKGYGFCDFADPETAATAIKILSEKECKGRKDSGVPARIAMALVPGPRKTATVFVGNIPYDATEDDVRAHLNQGGKVESFRMVFDKETMQPKGYGFCDFADPETAAAAIKVLSERECHGRLLRLDLADNELARGMPARGVSKGGEPGKTSTVFVGNIPYDATEDDVRGHLSQGGKVESFRMVFDKETLQPKGYGFCDFADPDTAITAIKILSEKECNGRLLRLDLADNDQSRGAPARAAAKAGSGTLALVGPEAPSRPRQPQAPPAPIKTSGTTAGSGVVTPSTVDPAAAAAAALEDPNVPADTIMASVAAHTDIVQTVASMPQELAKAAPERARAVLLEHPQLSHALLHAQFLLGLSLDQTMPPDLTETAELRAEAVQRAMSNSKTLAGPRRGAVPPARNVNASAPYPPNVIIPARPILPGGVLHLCGIFDVHPHSYCAEDVKLGQERPLAESAPLIAVGLIMGTLYVSFSWAYLPAAHLPLSSTSSVVFHSSFIMAVLSYERGITIDPGFIPDNWQKSENGRPIFEVEGGIVFMHE
ncbi:CSTF64, partial [Symbiodinium microadriaticum]